MGRRARARASTHTRLRDGSVLQRFLPVASLARLIIFNRAAGRRGRREGETKWVSRYIRGAIRQVRRRGSRDAVHEGRETRVGYGATQTKNGRAGGRRRRRREGSWIGRACQFRARARARARVLKGKRTMRRTKRYIRYARIYTHLLRATNKRVSSLTFANALFFFIHPRVVRETPPLDTQRYIFHSTLRV